MSDQFPEPCGVSSSPVNSDDHRGDRDGDSSVWLSVLVIVVINALAVHVSTVVEHARDVSDLDWVMYITAWLGAVAAACGLWMSRASGRRHTRADGAWLVVYAGVEWAIASATSWFGHGSALRLVIQLVTMAAMTWLLWPALAPALAPRSSDGEQQSPRSASDRETTA